MARKPSPLARHRRRPRSRQKPRKLPQKQLRKYLLLRLRPKLAQVVNLHDYPFPCPNEPGQQSVWIFSLETSQRTVTAGTRSSGHQARVYWSLFPCLENWYSTLAVRDLPTHTNCHVCFSFPSTCFFPRSHWFPFCSRVEPPFAFAIPFIPKPTKSLQSGRMDDITVVVYGAA